MVIAEYSRQQEGLIRILEVVRHRLESQQIEKWRRVLKTLKLVEYLLENGSKAFGRVFIGHFREKMKKFANFEAKELDQESMIRTSANRILRLTENRNEFEQKKDEKSATRRKVLTTNSQSSSTTVKSDKGKKNEPFEFFSSIQKKENQKQSYSLVKELQDSSSIQKRKNKQNRQRKLSETKKTTDEESKYDLDRFIKKNEGHKETTVKENEDLISFDLQEMSSKGPKWEKLEDIDFDDQDDTKFEDLF